MTGRAPLVAVLAALVLLLGSTTAHAGYTHYWKWKQTPAPEPMAACVADMLKIADAKRAILTDTEGRSAKDAQFRGTCAFGDAGNMACIVFNGIGDDAHETFGFPLAPFAGTPAFSFVKTAWKPYDLPAAACLIAARDHFPADVLEISSDGSWDNEWRDAAALYTRVLGRFAHNPLQPHVYIDAASGALEYIPGEPTPGTSTAEAPVRHSRTQTLIIGVVVITLIVAAYGLTRPKTNTK